MIKIKLTTRTVIKYEVNNYIVDNSSGEWINGQLDTETVGNFRSVICLSSSYFIQWYCDLYTAININSYNHAIFDKSRISV